MSHLNGMSVIVGFMSRFNRQKNWSIVSTQCDRQKHWKHRSIPGIVMNANCICVLPLLCSAGMPTHVLFAVETSISKM